MLRIPLLLVALCGLSVHAGRHRVFHNWGSSAGARPDLHWGEKEVFHGDYSVDESQLGGQLSVYKVLSQHGEVGEQRIPDGTQVVINDYEYTARSAN